MQYRRKLAIVFCALLFTSALYACVSSPSYDEIIANIQQSIENEQAIHLIQESSYITEKGKTNVSFVERWNDGPERKRLEIRNANGELITLSVQNGNKVQFYDAADNTFSDAEVYTGGGGLTSDALVPFVQNMQDNFDFTIGNTKELAGRPVLHLQAVPTGSNDSIQTIVLFELWIDAEHYTVLGTKVVESSGNALQEIPLQVEYDPELPDDIFTFSPPEGAVPR